MADIIRLDDDPHAQTQRLLPWYVNGALDDKEVLQVEKHLLECAECREDAEIEKALARQVKTLPWDVERGWAMLKARIDGPQAISPKAALFSRRFPIGWAVAAQAASLLIVIPLVTLGPVRPLLRHRTPSASTAASGSLTVVFRPDVSEATLRKILTRNQARIVDGPTASGAYILRVDPEGRAAVLARLQGDHDVSLAEATDGSLTTARARLIGTPGPGIPGSDRSSAGSRPGVRPSGW